MSPGSREGDEPSKCRAMPSAMTEVVLGKVLEGLS